MVTPCTEITLLAMAFLGLEFRGATYARGPAGVSGGIGGVGEKISSERPPDNLGGPAAGGGSCPLAALS